MTVSFAAQAVGFSAWSTRLSGHYGRLMDERASVVKNHIEAQKRGYRLPDPLYPIIPGRLMESDRVRFRCGSVNIASLTLLLVSALSARWVTRSSPGLTKALSSL